MSAEDPVARIIAVLALLVSFGNFLWSVYIGRRDSAQIAVDARPMRVYRAGQEPLGPYIAITARNTGRRPVTISQVGYVSRTGARSILWPLDTERLPYQAHDPDFPTELKEGEKHDYVGLTEPFSAEDRQQLGGTPLAYVCDELGRTYTAKIAHDALQLLWPGGAYPHWWEVWAHRRWKR
jgi:hypothetical protein